MSEKPFQAPLPVLSRLADVAMALLYYHFAANHFDVFAVTHRWQVGLVVLQETVLVMLFLMRRRTTLTTRRPENWIIAGVGTFAPLWLYPTGVTQVGTALQIAGLCISLASLLSLGRSFGIIPACRRAVTSGMYRVVRHPQYAGHHLLLAGYLLASPSLWNGGVVVVTIAAIWWRLFAEEAVLQKASAEYHAYCERVTSRVIPGVL